jgi:hypothetical protein
MGDEASRLARSPEAYAPPALSQRYRHQPIGACLCLIELRSLSGQNGVRSHVLPAVSFRL